MVLCDDAGRGTVVAITTDGTALLTAGSPGRVAVVRCYFIDLLSRDKISTLTEISNRARKQLDNEPP